MRTVVRANVGRRKLRRTLGHKGICHANAWLISSAVPVGFFDKLAGGSVQLSVPEQSSRLANWTFPNVGIPR